MLLYQIVETDEGLMVAEGQPGLSPEEVAAGLGGALIDPGPYKSYEEAYDAMMALQREDEEEDAGGQSGPV